MIQDTTYVGLDAHLNTISVALLVPGSSKPLEWQVAHEPRTLRRLVQKLRREAPGKLQACYEAGPCGYTLQRELVRSGVACQVVAPSLIPRKPGERIKTDRRDARKLAGLLRAGLLTEVHPPTPAQEAVRDLCRCREAAQKDLLRCRHRLVKFLQRRALRYTAGKKPWTHTYHRWLRGLSFEHAADQAVFDDYLLAVTQLEERVSGWDAKLEATAQTEPYQRAVGCLRCFRGLDTVTAMTIVAELHEIRRFRSPRELMAYLGLVPGEHSSADRTRRGRITKAGNAHVRHVLVEACWHYRHKPAVGAKLRRRREGQPGWVIAVADRVQHRLFRRYWQLCARGKPVQKTVVAMARELVGSLWSVLMTEAETTA